jgi:hypothetical protein
MLLTYYLNVWHTDTGCLVYSEHLTSSLTAVLPTRRLNGYSNGNDLPTRRTLTKFVIGGGRACTALKLLLIYCGHVLYMCMFILDEFPIKSESKTRITTISYIKIQAVPHR